MENLDQKEQDILAGKSIPAKGKTVYVRSPDDETFTVDSSELPKVLSEGYKIERPMQQVTREFVKENEGLKGTAKVALKSFADSASMGIIPLVSEAVSPSTALQRAKNEELTKAHEAASLTGTVAGFVPQMIYGGPLAKGGQLAAKAVLGSALGKAAAEAGVNLASNVVGKTAAGLASKIAQGGIVLGSEGAAMMAPLAITEAALGDPDMAAESLLAGGMLNIGIGGAIMSATGAGKYIYKLGKEVIPTAMKKGVETVTGVPKEIIDEYLQRGPEINSAPHIEDIKNLMDEAVAPASERLATAKESVKAAKSNMDEQFKLAQYELANTRPPEEIVDRLQAALESSKANIIEMSNQSHEILGKAGGFVTPDEVRMAAEKVIGDLNIEGIGRAVGVNAQKAQGKIQEYLENIVGKGDRDIPLSSFKKTMRQLDDDAKGAYDQSAGAFSGVEAATAKQFRRELDQIIKTKSPEYKAFMDELAPVAKLHDRALEAFGDKARTLTSFIRITSPTGALKEPLLKEFGDMIGQDFIGGLSQYKNAQALKKLPNTEDKYKLLVPDAHNNYQQAISEHAMAETALQPIKRLSPQRTQSIINNRKKELTRIQEPSIEDARALEALSAASGQDFAKMIRDRHILDLFERDTTAGSRKAVIGAMTGSFGGPIGAGIGSVVGAYLDKEGGRLVKKVLDNHSTQQGIILTEKAMKQLAIKLDNIRNSLGKKFGTIQKPMPALVKMSGLKSEHKQKNYDEVATKLNSAPNIEHVSNLLSQTGAPNIGMALNVKHNNAIMYLANAFPKKPFVDNPYNPRKYVPPDHEIAKFERKLEAVIDPFSIVHDFEHGKLTRDKVDAVKAVYPSIYNQIQKSIIDHATTKGGKISYDKRIQLSLLLGSNLDGTLIPSTVNLLQSNYLTAEANTNQANPDATSLDMASRMKTNQPKGA